MVVTGFHQLPEICKLFPRQIKKTAQQVAGFATGSPPASLQKSLATKLKQADHGFHTLRLYHQIGDGQPTILQGSKKAW